MSKPKQSTQSKQGDLWKYIEGWEPFLTDGCDLGFTLPYFKLDGVQTKMEWSAYLAGTIDDGGNIPNILKEKVEKQNAPWKVAGYPAIKQEDPLLIDDLVEYLKRHIWLLEERSYVVLASWVICTWLHEYMETSPRLIFYATTRSGKSRALKTLEILSYHGLELVSPTPAAIYRLIEKHHPSIFIDEYQDLDKEILPHIGVIFKSGFQKGGAVPRCDNEKDRSDVGFYQVFSPMAIGLKNRLPKEDQLNRSITIRMLEKPSSAKIVRRIQEPEAQDLRGRLLAIRFKVQAELIDLEPFKCDASLKAEREIPVRGKSKPVQLDDRSIESAAALLLPVLIMDGELMDARTDAVLTIVASSQAFAEEGLKETIEGRVFFALQAVYKYQTKLGQTGLDQIELRDVTKMTTKDVADQYNTDLSIEGDEDREHVKTRRITDTIKSLGFETKRGAHNSTYFEPEKFHSAYAINLKKYGRREDD